MAGANNQTIFRVAHVEKPFSMLGNAMLRDRRLSIAARGFLASIMSRGPNWKFNIRWAQAEHGVGRDKVYSLIQELVEFGYCSRQRAISATGQVICWEYHFTDCPELYRAQHGGSEFVDHQGAEPLTDFQEVDKTVTFVPVPAQPDPAQPDPENTDAYKERQGERESGKKTHTTAQGAPSPEGVKVSVPPKKAPSKKKGPAQGRLLESVSPPSEERLCVEEFDAAAAEVGFHRVGVLRPADLRALTFILRTYGRAAWSQAIANARESRLCRGLVGSGWVLSIDDMLDEKKFVKIMNGRYGKPALVKGGAADGVGAFLKPDDMPQAVWDAIQADNAASKARGA